MSNREQDEPGSSEQPLSDWLRRHQEGVSLLVLAAFMLWVRMRSYGNFTRGDQIYFSGNDAYYHLREVSYTVRNWPATMPYDVWTHYPYGTSVDQFGTLYDQIVATAALVVGLGSPSQETIAVTLLVAPAVIGALVVVPAYFAGRRVGGVTGGLFGAIVLALLPGSILSRSLVGASDHHVAEAFAMIVAVLAFMVALGVAQREKPVYELVLDRDYDALRRPVSWAAIAGVATGLYVWTWPPAVMFIGVVGVFFAVKMAGDFYTGSTPEPAAFVAVVSMTVAGVLSLLPLTTIGFAPSQSSLLQPIASFAIAGGAVFMAWLAREWDDRDLDRSLYPLTIAGIAVVGAALVAVASPSLWGTLVNNFERFIGFSSGAQSRTIREAQPFLSQVQPGVTARNVIVREYGFTFFTAVAALVYMLGRPLFLSRDRADHVALIGGLGTIALVYRFEVGAAILDVLPLGAEAVLVETLLVALVAAVAMILGDHDSEELFLAVWALFMTAAAFTQIRFNYYLALSVVLLNAYGLKQLLQEVDLVDTAGRVTDEIEPYQVMVVLMAALLVLPVLVVPVTYYDPPGDQRPGQATSPSWEIGNNSAPGNIRHWDDTLDWMAESTPPEGTYGGADNAMDPYGTHAKTNDFDYPEGSYGVMSWWDYGHWLTVESQRIPNANPFQQGATNAANFLLAPNESHANEVLQRGGEGPEETRYVVIDWQMVDPYGKFSAPTVFYDDANVSYEGDFVSGFHYAQAGNGYRPLYRLNKQRYYESTMVRLYRFHGSRVEPRPVVVDWEKRQTSDGETFRVVNQNSVQQYNTTAEARAAVRNDTSGTSAIGGIGDWVREPVPAVEHYRLVRASESTVQSGQGQPPSYLNAKSRLKVFERVEGATIQGSGAAPNANVTASVTMHIQSRDTNFTYTQQVQADENGEFEMTIPYSTTGYDKWGTEEGYTNLSVRATGPVELRSNTSLNGTEIWADAADAQVSEGKVIGEDESPVRVTLERQKVDELQLRTGGDGENSSSIRNPPASSAVAGGGAENQAALAEPVAADGLAPASAGESRADVRAPVDVHGGPGPAENDGPDGANPLPSGLFVLLAAGALLFEVRDERGR